MNVIALNGSPRRDGNTSIALNIMAEELQREGIATEIIHVGGLAVRGCTACNFCAASENNLCFFKDDGVNDIGLRMRAADGLIIGSPTYYGSIAGTLKCFLDRVFYSGGRSGAFRNKPAAAVAAVRRAGGVDVFNQLNNYFNLLEMVIPPSQYWAVAYGRDKGEVTGDAEGIQTLRRNANALAWLLKVLDAAKDTVPLPRVEQKIATNFIR